MAESRTLEIDKLIKELEDERFQVYFTPIQRPNFKELPLDSIEGQSILAEHMKHTKAKQDQIDEKILELRKERAILLDSNAFMPNNTEEKIEKDVDQNKSDYSNTTIRIGQKQQTISVWDRILANFNDLFELLKINNKERKRQAQIKWWIVLIYAIGRYIETENNENMLISDLMLYCHEFKEKWNNWKFEKKGTSKKSISKTDCDSANTILWNRNLSMRFKLSKDKKEILIAK